MTLPAGDSDRHPDRDGDPGMIDGDAELARRIWDRYAGSPGVISTAGVLQLSRRIAGAGRLPLLADVQRRWLPRGEAWPRGGSALLYARPAFYAEHPSSEPGVGVRSPVSTGAETPPPRARATAPSASSAGRVVQRETSPSASTADRPPEEVRSPGRAGDDVNATAPAAAETGGLGAAIVQRQRATPVGQSVQTQVTSPRSASLSEPAELLSGQVTQEQRADGEPANITDRLLVKPSSRPVDEQRPPAPQEVLASPAASGNLGAAIVQRYQGTPIKQVVRTRIADGGLMRLSEPVGSSSGQGAQVQRAGADRVSTADHPLVERSSRLTGESGSPVAQGEPTSPSADGGGTPGAAIVQRHRDTPVGRVTQAVSPGPLELSSGQGAQVQRVGTEVKFAMSAGSEMARAKPVTPVADGGDLGAALVQRHLGGPVWRMEERQQITVVPGPTDVVRQEVPGLQRLSASSVQSFLDLGVRQDAASTSPFGQSGVEPLAGLVSRQVEMPLARAAGGGSAPPVQLRSAASGTQTAVVQRATAETTAESGADVPAGESTLPGETQSGAEGPDVERLANEVYAIIERRLIIERESRGL